MTQTLTVPDVDFSGFYYPEILKELLYIFRSRREELGLTDENEYEAHIQLLRAFAYVGHNNNARVDLIAQEMLIDSLQMLTSLKRVLKLISVSLASASPAVVDLLIKLSEETTIDITGYVPELSSFTTDAIPPVSYEVLEEGGVDLTRTDQPAHVYGLEKVKSGLGQVSSTGTDIFIRESGDVFSLADISRHLFTQKGLGNNGGEFRITEFIDENSVRVVKATDGGNPGFVSETGLTWAIKEFTNDFATENNTPGLTYSPWATPEVGDALFIGHPQMMPGKLTIDVQTVAVGITGCWEYFDDKLSKFFPVSVVDNLDGTLTFDVNTLLGASDRRGLDAVIEFIPTGAKERVVSTYSGSNYATSSSYFGQVIPSVDPEDYLVTASWIPFENQDDSSLNFTTDGGLTFNFPQIEDRSWNPTQINAEEGWWSRYRIITVATPTSPIIDEINISSGDKYIVVQATQGETIGPQVLGSSDGSASQEFELSETPFLDNSEVIEVDETGAGVWVIWTRVENFLSSDSTSRHYMISTDATDKATIRFGDGITGKIPPLDTNNVRGAYRVGGDVDGNVGVGEVATNADGIGGIAEIYNPRSAYGWRMKDGGTKADIERVKRDAPAALRTRNTGSTISDIERLATKVFQDSNEVKPIARAIAVAEGFGAKTIKLLVVGSGGTVLSTSQLTEVETYFNGSRYTSPPTNGVLLLNSKLTAINYEPRLIQVKATVNWPGGNIESIRNALLSLLYPLAVEEEDEHTYVWDFNGWVSLSRIYSAIHAVDPGVIDVPTLLINGVNESFRLGINELPMATASTLIINVQA